MIPIHGGVAGNLAGRPVRPFPPLVIGGHPGVLSAKARWKTGHAVKWIRGIIEATKAAAPHPGRSFPSALLAPNNAGIIGRRDRLRDYALCPIAASFPA